MSDETTAMRVLFVCDEDTQSQSRDCEADEVDTITLTRCGNRVACFMTASTETGISDSTGRSSPMPKRLRSERFGAIPTPGTAVGIGRKKSSTSEERPTMEVEQTQIASPRFSGETPCQYTQLEPATETQEAVVAEGVEIPSPPPAFPALVDEESPHRAFQLPRRAPQREQLDEWSKLVKTFFQHIDERPLIVEDSAGAACS